MTTFDYVLVGLIDVVILFDIILDRMKKKTISQRVWDLKPPGGPMYVISILGFNLAYFIHSPLVGLISLGMWLLGHFAPR